MQSEKQNDELDGPTPFSSTEESLVVYPNSPPQL
jgi:hypothetical protein